MVINFFIVSILLAGAAFLIKNRNVNHLLVMAHSLFTLYLTIYEFRHLGEIQAVYFRADSLSIIFLTVLSLVTFMSSLHYTSYTVRGEVPMSFVNIHNFSTILFNTAIVGVLLAAHFGVLWAMIELTTLTAAMLIQHDRNETSMEATWKYLFVCSIAITIAFAGVLFLGIATQEAQSFDFSFDSIKSVASILDPNWTKACFLFVLTGFSVKMGLVPMFNVDIDAKDVSPSPVGAKLSSILVNAGFVSIYRFYEVFSGTEIHQWMNRVIIITAIISLFFAAVYMLKVRNIKRLLAYSSMEHAALAMLAFASGGIGYFAAVFHLVLHSLIKSSIFFQIGQLHNVFGSKLDIDIKDYLKVNPVGGLVLLTGFCSIIALPPSGMFISEFLIFQSIFESHRFWLLALSFLLLLFIIYGMGSRLLTIIFNDDDTGHKPNTKNARIGESLVQLGVIVAVFYIGFFKPTFIVNMIQTAVQTLP